MVTHLAASYLSRREPILADDQDRHRFLETLGEPCEKTGWQGQACCLYDNLINPFIGE